MKRPTISACLITLNEAQRLPALLPRLAWADEIVVVDGQSTDGTAELARQAGCRVEVHPFDTFARQRNRALHLAQSEWILSIDADELPTRGLVQELWSRLPDCQESLFRVQIRSRIFGRVLRFSGTQDDWPVRLFRRQAADWHGDVHERLCPRNPTDRVGRLSGFLEHDTLPDLAAFLQKMDRYTALAARQLTLRGIRPRWRDAWLRPPVEVFRRLIWKCGGLDGPEGWAFCLLSGLSEWVLSRKHRQLWEGAR